MDIGDKKFSLFIDEKRIQAAVEKVAERINLDFKGDVPLFISVLNGSFMFTSDLLKNINGNVEVEFIKMSSYEGVATTGNVNQLIGLNRSLTGRNVVILEDIVDTGNTLEKVYKIIQEQNPLQIKVAALFLKPTVYKKNIKVDYVGMEIENDFIIGYGLDYNGLGRNFKDVFRLI